MRRKCDEVAYSQAVRQWALPECVHVPVAAADEVAISDHIGDIVEVLSPGRALVVAIDAPPGRDARLPIWRLARSEVLFDPIQVWVSPSYTRYRAAYIKVKGGESVSGMVLAHTFNRRLAAIRGYRFVRLVAVSRGTNSSSGYTEQWGIENNSQSQLVQRIRYADLADLMVLLDLHVGGGVLESFRVAQDLIEVPGICPAQASFK